MYPETSLIIVDDFAAREITKPPPLPAPIHLPRDAKVSATRGCWRMNNTMEAPAGCFPLFKDGEQEGDGSFSRESHTRYGGDGSTPSQPPSPTPTSTTNTWQTANRHNIISRSFPTTLKQQQQDRIRSSVGHEVMTKTSSPPPPPPLLAPRNASYPQLITPHRSSLSNGHIQQCVKGNETNNPKRFLTYTTFRIYQQNGDKSMHTNNRCRRRVRGA